MNEIRESLAKLQLSDVKKISDLCLNYNKLRKYSKLIGNQKQNLAMRLKGKLEEDSHRFSCNVLL
jgi:hypothetical protein